MLLMMALGEVCQARSSFAMCKADVLPVIVLVLGRIEQARGTLAMGNQVLLNAVSNCVSWKRGAVQCC